MISGGERHFISVIGQTRGITGLFPAQVKTAGMGVN